jgi:PIN domain nuclease of toxin-antitoxin system
MKLLLDTHILIWAAADALPAKAVPYISDLENTLLFSSASIWEILIKKNLNRPDFTVDPFLLYRGLLDNGYIELDITSHHVLRVGDLPPIHKDPFDRILLAQAKAEGATLLTADDTISRYPGMILYVG